MAEVNESQKITVQIPAERSNSSPLPTTQSGSQVEKFKQGSFKAISLPDNLADLIFDVTASITIPALISSCLDNFQFPGFIHLGGFLFVIVTVLFIWHLLAFAEIRSILILRIVLIAIGVFLGL